MACIFPLADFDIWWHLRTGELILEQGAVPQFDSYTYPDAGKRWIDLHWGFQILVAVLFRSGGADAIIFFKATIIACAVALAWCAAGREAPDWSKGLVFFPAVVAIAGRAYERPEMLSQFFLATWLCLIVQLDRRPWLVWTLPCIQIAWVNCHVLFVLGLVVGAAWLFDRLVRGLARGRFGCEELRGGVPMRRAIPALLGAALVSVLNPYFEEGAMFPLVVYRKFTVEQSFYATRIGEFQRPLDFLREHGLHSFSLTAELFLWCLGLGSFLALGIRHRRWSPLRAALFAAFSHLAWEAARNTNIFALVTAVVTCANIGDLVRSRKTAKDDRADAGSRWPDRLAWALAGVWLLGILAVVTNVWSHWTGMKSFGWGERPAWFAHAAAKFASRDGFPTRALVAHNGQAAVYTYHNGPERKVFLDGRLEVCTRQTFESFEQACLMMQVGDRSWEFFHRQNYDQLPVLILDRRSAAAEIYGLLQTPGWRLVFADETAAVFVDTSTAHRLALPHADPSPLGLPPVPRRDT